MAELTKEEQIQAIYDLKVGYTLGHADIAMLKAMARQLLASMEQAPVYLRPFGDDGETFVACDGNDERAIPLYAAPQLPQPAVPDENGLLRCPFCGSAARVVDNRLGFYVQCCSDNCDGIAIGPRAPELQSEQEEKSIDWEALAQAAKDKWNRRAAMLQGAERVSQPYTLRDGWVAVPVEPTAEMVKKMRYHCGGYDKNIKDGYKAMLAAAPQHE